MGLHLSLKGPRAKFIFMMRNRQDNEIGKNKVPKGVLKMICNMAWSPKEDELEEMDKHNEWSKTSRN